MSGLVDGAGHLRFSPTLGWLRTPSRDYVRDGIHMNAVDTGWVTDEARSPARPASATSSASSPPLDVVDGTARVLDPFLSGLGTGRHAHGRFFKDHAPSSW